MNPIIDGFSGKCIASVKSRHSSMVEFHFNNPEFTLNSAGELTGGSAMDHNLWLTLDYCVWHLVFEQQPLIDSNDVELEQKLSILIGDTISSISQITSFAQGSRDHSEQQGIFGYGKVVVTFGSRRKLFIYPHRWDEETYKGDGSAPLMTLLGKSAKLIYLENGEIQHQHRDN